MQTRGKSGAVRLGKASRHPDIVFLIHVFFRRQQLVSQSALIGQQQQAFRVLIQPSHREQALPLQILRQQIQHRCSPAVLRGGQIPSRLVQHDPSIPAPVQQFSVDGDHSLLRVCFFFS